MYNIKELFERKLRRFVYSEKSGKAVLFHGSYEPVKYPSILEAVNVSECGRGFYLFTNPEAAVNHRNRKDHAIVSVYTLDLNNIPVVNVDIYGNSVRLYEDLEYNYCLCWFHSGKSSYVNFYGGQVCIKDQGFLNEHLKYVGSYDRYELISLFNWDLINHKFGINRRISVEEYESLAKDKINRNEYLLLIDMLEEEEKEDR